MSRRNAYGYSGNGDTSKKKRLRRWLLSVEGGGDGLTVECAFGCGKRLTESDMTLDHYPIPAWKGGTLSRENVRAACSACNEADGRVQSKLREAEKARERAVGWVTYFQDVRRRDEEEDVMRVGARLNQMGVDLVRVKRRLFTGTCDAFVRAEQTEEEWKAFNGSIAGKTCGEPGQRVNRGELDAYVSLWLCPEHLEKYVEQVREKIRTEGTG